MKNASLEQIMRANIKQEFDENVVYNADFFEGCCHYHKKVHVKYTANGVLLLEDMLGQIHLPSGAVVANQTPKGPSQQPKKPRRKPVKGTKPETLVPMSADIKLKVGDKIVLSNGVRAKIDQVDCSEIPYAIGATKPRCVAYSWYTPDGYVHSSRSHNIAYIVRPWQAPVAEEKCQAQKDFEAGLWVAFLADPKSVCPVWAREEEVQVLLNNYNNVSAGADLGKYWNWGVSHVVAYRKAKR